MDNKSDINYWTNILCPMCKACNGTGRLDLDEESGSVVVCTCVRKSRAMVVLNDPDYGIPEKYQGIKFGDLDQYTLPQIKQIKKKVLDYAEGLNGANDINPYRNCIIKGGPKSGKTSILSMLFRAVISYEYDAYRVRFSQLTSLSRMFYINSKAFNESKGLREVLFEAPFLFIEDVDNRGQTDHEKMSYNFFDDVFSYRASHKDRATIFTIDSKLKITPEFLGPSFFNEIYQVNVDNDDIFEITLPRLVRLSKKEEDTEKSTRDDKLNNIKSKNKKSGPR